MRRIALLLLLLLSGCDLDTLQQENTIKAGRVYWDGPDMSRLLTALDTCRLAPSSMDELCNARRNEAFILLEAIKTCADNSLPACKGIMYWTLKGNGRNWVYMTQHLKMTPNDFDGLPREDLEAGLIPKNKFIWAVWGMDDAMEVSRRWIMRHLTWLVMGIGLPLLAGLGFLSWRSRQNRIRRLQREKQEHLAAIRHRENAKVEAAERAAREQAAEAYRRKIAEADNALRTQAEAEARQQEALEEAERRATAEAEEARANAILTKAFPPQQPNHQRKQKRKWKGPRPRPTPQNT